MSTDKTTILPALREIESWGPRHNDRVVCGQAANEIERLRGWLSYIRGNFRDHRECAEQALSGDPIPETFTP